MLSRLEEVNAEMEAARERLELTNLVEMPANNKMLVFTKR